MILKNKLVRDVMTRGVVTVTQDTKIPEIADLLVKQKLSGVGVTGDTGEILGFISETDMLAAFDGEDWQNMTAETVMTPNIKAIKPNHTLIEAARAMRSSHIHRLLVLSEGGIGAPLRPIGILSASDIVRELSKELA